MSRKKNSNYASFKDTAVTEKQLSRVKVPKSITSTKSGLYADLYKEYKVLAKRADQRLVELEKLQNTAGYENVTKWSYGRAARDIKIWSGDTEKPRFNTVAPESTQGLKAKIEDIKTFLESATSSKTKIRSSFQNRANTINEKYGTSFTWQDMGKFFESETWERMKTAYGSKSAVRAVGKINRADKPSKRSKTEYSADESVTSEIINKIASEYGDEVRDFFS